MIVENFIAISEDALSSEICDSIIKHFEETPKINLVGEKGGLQRKDQTSVFQLPHTEKTAVMKCLADGINQYASFIESTNQILEDLEVRTIKVQKTEPTGGFHYWHIEQDAHNGGHTRALAWTIYLNDVSRGGETEFLYQGVRIPPLKGLLSIFPAGITHPHRGNPPYDKAKYIITGWYELTTHSPIERYFVPKESK